MLIAHKAVQKLREKNKKFAEFADMLDDTSKNYKAYMNLGSVGPDLYYYTHIVQSIKDILTEGFVKDQGVTPWSYHLHSNKPNLFCLKLSEILFKDVTEKDGKIELDDNDWRKLAYIAGHLTHIAADQIIHPIVNKVAGPYYRSGENRKKHRECEVFQDYFLYTEVYRLEEKEGAKYNFFEQDFRDWADCIKEVTFKNTEDWFRYFLQRGFAETYSIFPSEDEIENAVDNLLLTLRVSKMVGPYKTAANDYSANGEKTRSYQDYIQNISYLKYYRLAVELSVVYLIILHEIYSVLKEKKDFTRQHSKWFLNVISDADLSCPLEQDILVKSCTALNTKANIKRVQKVLKETEFLTMDDVLKMQDDKEVVKA
jgi:hypothetical protein